MKTYTKICPECGREFTTTSGVQIYCNLTCKKLHNYKKKRQKIGVKKLKAKTCKLCGEKFTPTVGHQVYCSDRCMYQAKLKRQREWKQANIKPQVCPVCGRTFKPTRAHRDYCSAACAKEAELASRRSLQNEYKPLRIVPSRAQNDIHRLAAQALANGLSYGQYVAMIEQGARYEHKRTED